MSRNRLLWLAVAVAVAVIVAYQVVASSGNHSAQFIAGADIPTVAPGIDVLAGVTIVPVRIRGYRLSQGGVRGQLDRRQHRARRPQRL